ncbi:PqiC family protein [Halomonas llamarensis]|uniref:ABC-type transport auxiliary lipoprotein family protein n=1 Tax=Halomonas llamarensis TaxID=2945104 RepID=A0ABT0SP14_9GAMM|nr:ABC-type transport auxiliary lipoprotein family protein [Halomonas llamarensis]MCL7929134.1 ABC-type transport auxiliary lipoprotein family protein [Halomonas llamarensis]
MIYKGKKTTQWAQCARPALLALLLGLLLGACASSVSPPTRYVLPSVNQHHVPKSTKAELNINSVRLAHYLDVDGIIMQLDDIEMREAREHQWAEGLNRQLARNLRDDLAAALKEVQVVNSNAGSDNAFMLRLDVDEFHGRYDGYAVASGQWQLRDAQNKLLHVERFQTRTALKDDGYPALVRALSQSWKNVAADIASTLTQKGYLPQ